MARRSKTDHYSLAWYCPNPPDLEDWQSTTTEDLSEYRNIIDYIRHHAELIDPEELFIAIRGGETQVLADLMYGSVYDEYARIADDSHISWFRSSYPDGTIVYYHTHSGIEHVYEPAGYDLFDAL